MSELGFLAFGLPDEVNPVEAAQEKAAAIQKINEELNKRGIIAFALNADSVPEVEQRLLMRDVDTQINEIVSKYLPEDDDAKKRVVSNIFRTFEASHREAGFSDVMDKVKERIKEVHYNRGVSKGLICAKCTSKFATPQRPGSVCRSCHEGWFDGRSDGAVETNGAMEVNASLEVLSYDEDPMPYGDEFDETATDSLNALEGDEYEDEEVAQSSPEDESEGTGDYFCDDENCDCNTMGIPHEGTGEELVGEDDSEDLLGEDDSEDALGDSDLPPIESRIHLAEDDDGLPEDQCLICGKYAGISDPDPQEPGECQGHEGEDEESAMQDMRLFRETGQTRNCRLDNHSDCWSCFCGCHDTIEGRTDGE